MAKSIRIPAYRRHSFGQARVTIFGKNHLLGTYNSEESKVEDRFAVLEPNKLMEHFRTSVNAQEDHDFIWITLAMDVELS